MCLLGNLFRSFSHQKKIAQASCESLKIAFSSYAGCTAFVTGALFEYSALLGSRYHSLRISKLSSQVAQVDDDALRAKAQAIKSVIIAN